MGIQLLAQKPGYQVTFNQIFDNREYFSAYGFPQTIFGARLDAALCLELDSLHGISAGFNYLYENGSSILGVSPQVILYYKYSGKQLNMKFGSFPRIDKLDYPLVFLNDTLNYYRPNIEGAYLYYKRDWGFLDGFIDWTGRVSEESRETFLVGINSKVIMNGIYFQPTFLMYHNAKSFSPLDTVPLQDNGIMSLLAGYKSVEMEIPIDFDLSTGIVASYNRFRPDAFSWGRGLIFNIKMRYTIFGLKGVYYVGTPIDFTYGDPFYRSGNYGRLDLFIDPFHNPKVKSKIGWNLHYIPGEGIHHSQQVLISVIF